MQAAGATAQQPGQHLRDDQPRPRQRQRVDGKDPHPRMGQGQRLLRRMGCALPLRPRRVRQHGRARHASPLSLRTRLRNQSECAHALWRFRGGVGGVVVNGMLGKYGGDVIHGGLRNLSGL